MRNQLIILSLGITLGGAGISLAGKKEELKSTDLKLKYQPKDVESFFSKPKLRTLEKEEAPHESQEEDLDPTPEAMEKSFESALQEMTKMRQQTMKLFDDWVAGMDPFQGHINPQHEIARINEREDDHFIYFEIPIKNLKKEKLKVNIANGMVQVTGQIEKKKQGKHASSYYSSSFHRSFPVPAGVDADKVQMSQEKDQLVVKFPKVKS